MSKEELKEFSQYEECVVKSIYDFGMNRNWLTEDFCKLAKELGIRIEQHELSVDLIK